MNEYLVKKVYDSNFGDILPEICCRALRINLVVVFKDGNSLNVFVIPNANACYTAVVLKTLKHYDGIRNRVPHVDSKGSDIRKLRVENNILSSETLPIANHRNKKN